MNTWALPGKQCVCVSDFWTERGIDGPAFGETLTISETYLNPAGLVTLRFTKHPGWIDEHTGQRNGYNVRNFRPVVDEGDDVSLFEHHLGRQDA